MAIIMKKLIFTVFILFCIPLFAQEDTMKTEKDYYPAEEDSTAQYEVILPKFDKFGVIGGLSMKLAQINGNIGLFTGGDGGVIFNNSLMLGGAGYTLATKIDAGKIFTPNLEMDMSYGGVILGYINNNNDAVHYNIQALIGGGSVSWSTKTGWFVFKHWTEENDEYFGKDYFFVIEPSANVDMRLTKFISMEFGLSYLFALDVKSEL